MKTAPPQRHDFHRAGITFLEMTVVIAVLLSLISILVVGARSWKRAADRSACILNLRNVQVSARAYQNLHGYAPGTRPSAQGGSQSILDQMLSHGFITDQLHSTVKNGGLCPGGGHYHVEQEDLFPPVGQLYLSCSLDGEDARGVAEDAQW